MVELAERWGLEAVIPAGITGRVMKTEGLLVVAQGLPVPIGSVVSLERRTGSPIEGEVIGFDDSRTLVFPLGPVEGLRRGDAVRLRASARRIRVGRELLGRVVDARGRVIDPPGTPFLDDRVAVHKSPPPATDRPRIDTGLSTGVRALDALLTCGKGQRLGIFAGSGVGKSVLLGMMARYTAADVNVIALVGERGREVNEFLQRDLGPDGRARSTVVVATGDEPAVLRVQAAYTATAIAEYFAARGNDVLFMMDSVTRFAMAQREIGLAAGEPPTTRGYPPSVYALLPRLVERAGRTPRGSITAFYSVLVEGDDPNEPISDAVRGLLDGHVFLSRELAAAGHYPAIDVLSSISRLMNDIASPEHLEAARQVRRLLAAYRDHADLISIGAYRSGSNRLVDAAIALKPDIDAFLQQAVTERATAEETTARLRSLQAAIERQLGPTPQSSPAASSSGGEPTRETRGETA